MKAYLVGIFLFLGFVALETNAFGQSTNRPFFSRTRGEQLLEKENHFAGNKHHGGLKGFFHVMRQPKGFNHQKRYQKFHYSKKKSRSAFQRRRYTGQKKWYTPILKPIANWGGGGGRSYRTRGREDKHLFKAPGRRSRKRNH